MNIKEFFKNQNDKKVCTSCQQPHRHQIKWDESNDEDWLLLIYINNNSLDEGIVIEDKSNPEKNLSHEFKSNEILILINNKILINND